MLNVLQISDGKRGHEVQVEGLLQALANKLPLAHRLYRLNSTSLDADFVPDWVMGAGSATHTSILRFGWKYRAKKIVLMRPKWPGFLFDACIVPAHDRPAPKANLFVSQGSINNISVKTSGEPNQGLFLVGGPSKHIQWSSAAMADKVVAAVVANPDIHWQLTTSRRTPDDFLPRLAAMPNLSAYRFDALPATWLRQQLQSARYAFVSNDSVNMVYEALTAGLSVAVMKSPDAGASRVLQGLQQLIDAGQVLDTDQSFDIRQQAAVTNFDEAERCAAWLIGKGFYQP